MTIEDRIERMGEAVNDLHDELQYAESQAEADRINRAIDTLNKRIKKMAEDNDIELYDSWKGID
jgi:ubiquinone biosynthesis protein UbiJ